MQTHNYGMETQQVPVNRATVGVLALACLIASGALFAVTYSSSDQGGWVFLRGGLARIGILLSTIWLALPSRNQESAWANLSPRMLIMLLLAALLTTRVRLQVLIPAALAVGMAILVLRPRPKHRPSDRIAG